MLEGPKIFGGGGPEGGHVRGSAGSRGSLGPGPATACGPGVGLLVAMVSGVEDDPTALIPLSCLSSRVPALVGSATLSTLDILGIGSRSRGEFGQPDFPVFPTFPADGGAAVFIPKLDAVFGAAGLGGTIGLPITRPSRLLPRVCPLRFFARRTRHVVMIAMISNTAMPPMDASMIGTSGTFRVGAEPGVAPIFPPSPVGAAATVSDVGENPALASGNPEAATFSAVVRSKSSAATTSSNIHRGIRVPGSTSSGYVLKEISSSVQFACQADQETLFPA